MNPLKNERVESKVLNFNFFYKKDTENIENDSNTLKIFFYFMLFFFIFWILFLKMFKK
jgi:hypothetical protein